MPCPAWGMQQRQRRFYHSHDYTRGRKLLAHLDHVSTDQSMYRFGLRYGQLQLDSYLERQWRRYD